MKKTKEKNELEEKMLKKAASREKKKHKKMKISGKSVFKLQKLMRKEK